MKNFLKKLVIIIISNDYIYKLFDKLLTYGWMIKFQRQLLDRKKNETKQSSMISKIFKTPVVLNGPFKGLKYPKFKSRSSSLYSKLIGSYEMELHSTIKQVVDDEFDQIINIGCAEGYYAVGLAICLPNAEIYAYDIDSEARELTSKMASLNGVSERVFIKTKIDTNHLKKIDFTKKTLIISDVEGYERHIFVPSVVNFLKKCSLIIETHDWVDIHISSNIENIFKSTHNIKSIQSVGDNIKAKTYKFSELKDADLLTKFRIFEEGRRFVDEWLIMSPKNN